MEIFGFFRFYTQLPHNSSALRWFGRKKTLDSPIFCCHTLFCRVFWRVKEQSSLPKYYNLMAKLTLIVIFFLLQTKREVIAVLNHATLVPTDCRSRALQVVFGLLEI